MVGLTRGMRSPGTCWIILRAPGDMLKYLFWERSEALLRRLVDPDTALFRASKRIYHLAKAALNLPTKF
jgi:hypothetical protein